MRPINQLIIHCSATAPSQDIGAQEIDRWHRMRGYLSIGYHFVIRRDGTLERGRTLDRVGAHAAGFNNNSIGICLVGGLKEGTQKGENNFTPAQWDALTKLCIDLKKQFPTAEILGHRDLPKVAKECPCFDARAWASKKGLK